MGSGFGFEVRFSLRLRTARECLSQPCTPGKNTISSLLDAVVYLSLIGCASFIVKSLRSRRSFISSHPGRLKLTVCLHKLNKDPLSLRTFSPQSPRSVWTQLRRNKKEKQFTSRDGGTGSYCICGDTQRWHSCLAATRRGSVAPGVLSGSPPLLAL